MPTTTIRRLAMLGTPLLAAALLAGAPAFAGATSEKVPAASPAAAAPAQAAGFTEDRTFSCSAHGFTGTFHYVLNSTGFHWSYRINKGSNAGGNHANVNISDYGTTPMTWWKSPDSMVQDNVFHGYPAHTRGSGNFDVTFIFDLTGAGDPSCVAHGGVLV
ncbi:MAG: hypothetical protein QOJ46_1164 [bacterium]|jgi:hypothetical protein